MSGNYLYEVAAQRKKAEKRLQALREIEELMETIKEAQEKIEKLSEKHGIAIVYPKLNNDSDDFVESWEASDEWESSSEWESSDEWIPSDEEDVDSV